MPEHPGPTVLVIFGAGGDLTWRKLIPALYNLYLDDWLPDKFKIIGVDVKPMSEEDFRARLRGGVNQFSRRGAVDPKAWNEFATRLCFAAGDFENDALFKDLDRQLDATDKEWNTLANRIFYLAIPPSLIHNVVEQLGHAKLTDEVNRERIVIEKPFGRDLATARDLNRFLTGILNESQIYRIDHYLGKETVQDILAFRFANVLFEPVWNRRYIDNIQITVAEDLGVEHRGGYYEQAGALRDMIQNHLMQVMCLIAMEAPVSFDSDEIRNKAVDVLRAVHRMSDEKIGRRAVRGQYGAGWIRGERVPAYRAEPDVAPNSNTETYAAVRLDVDNWRWQDVPFYLRTGKRLRSRVSEVSVQFRPVPHNSFPDSCVRDWAPNRMAVRIQPDEGILLRTHAKQPGPTMRLTTVDMQFSYRTSFKVAPPEAYENLLLDAMIGDATLFMRADQIEEAWSIVTPILDGWADMSIEDEDIYPVGTWGPGTANALLARDGRHWLLPTAIEEMEREENALPKEGEPATQADSVSPGGAGSATDSTAGRS